jgi:hypothetical protein
MTNPTKLVVNCETGVQEEIELTNAEVAEREAAAAAFVAQQAEREAAEAAKAVAKASAESKLAALGLTADEIAALTK